jgi:hypothetical protein
MRFNIENVEAILERLDAQIADMQAQLSVLENGRVALRSTDGSGEVFITGEWSSVARRNLEQLIEIRESVEHLRGGRFTAKLVAQELTRTA